MSATLSIVNNFSLPSQGITKTGKQGLTSSGLADAYAITVTGNCTQVTGQLATATVFTVFDDDVNTPSDFVYFHFWADQDCYLQIIGSGSNAVFKVGQYQPVSWGGFDSILCAANTSVITGGSEPAVTDIDSIIVGNYSGNTLNFIASIIQ